MCKKSFINNNLNNLLTYLKTEKNSKYNNIYTTASYYNQITTIPERNADIGLAQIHLSINTLDYQGHYSVKKYNVRLETGVYQGILSIATKKTVNLLKSDIILFGNVQEVYISENNSWLTDPKYYTEETVTFTYGKYTFKKYNIQKLYKDKYIKQLFNVDIYTCVDSYGDEIEKYITNDYNLSITNDIHNDPKVCNTVFYGYVDDQYTDNMGTCRTIANYYMRITGINENAIYQKLQRAKRETIEKQKSIPAKITVSEDNYKNNICNKLGLSQETKDRFEKNDDNTYTLKIFISESPEWDICKNARVNKTEDMKEYQKGYQKGYQKEYQKERLKDEEYLIKQKVRKYLKGHNNQVNPKWTEKDLEIANMFLQKK